MSTLISNSVTWLLGVFSDFVEIDFVSVCLLLKLIQPSLCGRSKSLILASKIGIELLGFFDDS